MIIDSSALLAYILGEPGSDRVESLLETSLFISTVNYVESILRLKRQGASFTSAVKKIETSNLRVIDFTQLFARQAAAIDVSGNMVLSLGDRACLGTAIGLGLPVVTADRAWAKLNLPIKVMAIR
ncbi:MAG: type II toxin-antitoxin system VapC family toxin [Patescibacteria group bacterium]